MERRKFLIGAGSLAAGGAAALGSGAFTSVSAERSIAVDVADDANAFLSIEPQDTPNGNEYAKQNADGQIELDFSNANEFGGGNGLNRDATTTIRDILKVTNAGTQDVIVGVSGLPDFMSIYTDDGTVAANGNSTSLNQDSSDPGSSNLAAIGDGGKMEDVGVIFRLQGEDATPLENFTGTLVFNAISVEELDNTSEVRDNYSNL